MPAKGGKHAPDRRANRVPRGDGGLGTRAFPIGAGRSKPPSGSKGAAQHRQAQCTRYPVDLPLTPAQIGCSFNGGANEQIRIALHGSGIGPQAVAAVLAG